ncbi:MAG: nitronate monooxygenase, partial [Planctomycetes bacterium]|nr:nitronate monooxygenase [Planctomycetota bacterium]
YYIEGGKDPLKAFKLIPLPKKDMGQVNAELFMVTSFAEVFLAKEGHDNPIATNLLEKIQIPNLPSLYGAMLANVDYVIMGAGIPGWVPEVLDAFAAGNAAELSLKVNDNPDGEKFIQRFDPSEFLTDAPKSLKRPRFLPIISSDIIGKSLHRRCGEGIFGFIVENFTAGGHNAPPRKIRGIEGTPSAYSEKDIPDLERIKNLGYPFWLAGSHAHPDKMQEALDLGATVIQIGTAFALCHESGLDNDLKYRTLETITKQRINVITDFRGSPTGYPFKVVPLSDTAAEDGYLESRSRICDLGYLRTPYRKAEGELGYRCPSEPIKAFVNKGGDIDDTVGRRCICNGLQATVGYGQIQKSGAEAPLITTGDSINEISDFITEDTLHYSATVVLDYILKPATATTEVEA